MKTILRVVLLSLIAVSVFTTCDTSMGMGKQVDFEPPVLTIEPKPPTPMYVKLGAQLSGTVTDNDTVDRVILLDSTTREHLFTAALLPNDRWEISLDFSADQNGQTIFADVVAYDRAGNSGAESIVSIIMVIDVRPPLVTDIWVQRTSVRTGDILPFNVLKQYETDDPNAEISKNADVFQNGAFYIRAKIAEDDTSLESVVLKIYDHDNPDTELLSLEPDKGFTFYTPQWYVTEDMLLNAGNSLIASNYSADYKNNNKRYYYRLRIIAVDKSKNESGSSLTEDKKLIVEDQGYLCLWNQADYPKGILDTRVVGAGYDLTVVKGSTLPVEFFDDDKIDWAYAALFTKEQWAGTNNIASGVKITGADDNAKFKDLETKLRAGSPVIYNWNYDRHNDTTEPVVNVVPADGADEKTYFIITGNKDTDYGDFVFVTLVKDKKLAPHKDGEYPAETKYRKYNVTLVDENAPLIVFDKTTDRLPVGTPEENTFPDLTSDGKFTIHGYTLREDKGLVGGLTAGVNKVVKFRLAWVPFSLASNDSEVENVKEALKKAVPADGDFPAGVQYWNFDTDIAATSSSAIEKIGDNYFRKQYFSKVFSILGDPDDKKGTQYDNFTRTKGNKSTFENATKLFIFYAEDNMGHPVTRQFYLLGNKTLPTIDVYDITDMLTMPATPAIPDVFDFGAKDGIITPDYISARNTYNTTSYPTLKTYTGSLSDGDKTDPYRVYPRGTTIKLWSNAKANGALGIESIKMDDITFEGAAVQLGYYNSTDQKLGYVEFFREVTQRVFLFTAIDKLGNEAKAQRSIAIANAAALTSITTSKQNGTYPKDEIIEIRANFDGMVKLESNVTGTRPKLNVLYKIGTGLETSLDYGVAQIECEPVTSTTGVLYLTFNFKVPENAKGKLLTIYKGIPDKPGMPGKPTANPTGFPNLSTAQLAAIDRPITLTSGNNIIDAVRGDSAYTPGNVTGFYWESDKNSLQEKKEIKLDGEPPRITLISIVDTKNPFEPDKWYLKSGESISFQITASEPLKVKGDSTTALSFRLRRPNNAYSPATGYDTTHFDYRKVTGSTIIFTLDVNKTNIPNDGILQTDISLVNSANITDDAGNPVVTSTFTTALNTFFAGKTIYFDLTPPVRPETTLTGSQTQTQVGTSPAQSAQYIYYGATPTLAITNHNANDEPYDVDKKQYSLDGGLNWVDFPTPINTEAQPWTSAAAYNTLNILNGQWSLKTRFIDRAGNEGATTNQLIHVNNVFPKLLGITAVQPSATYNTGTLQFKMDFDDIVSAKTNQLANITISLKDITTTSDTLGGIGVSPTYRTNTISPAAIDDSRTLTFSWTLAANTKDMLNGLALNSIDISGLEDRFGNRGTTSITSISFTNSTVTVTYPNPKPAPATLNYTVSYNLSGVKVSTIQPSVTQREPDTAINKTGNISTSVSGDNKKITLTFSKPMQKGNGTITIRPRAGYAIPAVFENDGYYIAYTYDTKGNVTGETKSSTAGTDSIYVSGFYDIFNSINNTDRNTLIGGTLMSAPALSNVTGLSVGPYLKTTHGLTQGAGYTGFYGNNGGTATIQLPGINAPGTRNNTVSNGDGKNNFMIPDVETKWVLAYSYSNLFDTTGVVNNIRAVLDRAKFRWQEIAVTNPSVVISGTTVTITLPEPLLPGLQWDVYYPEGTFTDTAGNKALKSGNFDGGTTGNTNGVNNDYWFWSTGVQKPVIRVDRKSFDARAGGTGADYRGAMWSTGQSYSATGYNGNIASFNTISFKITSETPNARIEYITKEGKSFTTGTGTNEVPIGSITAAWTGRVTSQTLSNITNTANITWSGPKLTPTATIGTWVRPNLIFRNYYATGDGQYNIMEDGMNISKGVRGGNDQGRAFGNNDDNQRFYGFRSYNKDATFSELNGETPSTVFTPNGTASFTYDAAGLEASKNYVIAQAKIDHTSGTYNAANAISSQKGFEGVFRTVLAFNQYDLVAAGSNGAANIVKGAMNGNNNGAVTTNGNPMMLDGSNVRSGMPTIAGFPVRDNACDSDSRYTKVFHRIEATNATARTNGKQFYWVSSEIIGPWYAQPFGKGNGAGSHGRSGDVEDWLTAGYGDLTYVLNWATW